MRTQRIEWEPHFDRQTRSGLSAKEYCRREGLSCWSFYAARERLRRIPVKNTVVSSKVSGQVKGGPLPFIRVHTPEPAPILVRFPDATVLEINGDITSEQLAALVGSLRGSFRAEGAQC